MAAPIQRMEKDYLIQVLYDEQIPIIYVKEHGEYILTLVEPASTEMVFHPDRPINGLYVKNKLELKFSYRGSVISFTVDVASIKDGLILCNIPDSFYKDVERSSVRVSAPPDMQIQLGFSGVMEYGQIVDISASGILFAYSHPDPSSSLLPDSELAVKIITPRRSITAGAKIVRRLKDASIDRFGCRFYNMAPEDVRFLFEYIYGKPYAGTDAAFLMGQI